MPRKCPSPQDAEIAKLERQGYVFSNWIPAHPDAENEPAGDGEIAVMVKRNRHRTEYREIEPDGTVN